MEQMDSITPQSSNNEEFNDLINDGNTLMSQYQESGDSTPLNEAITCFRKSLLIRSETYPDRYIPLLNLAHGLWYRYEQSGNVEDVEEALRCAMDALQRCPPDHPGCSTSMLILSKAFRSRFEDQGAMVDLQQALAFARGYLLFSPVGDPGRSSALNNVANCLLDNFERLGNLADLEESIRLYQDALQLRPHGHPERSDSLNNLANAILTRFEQRGDITDLGDAISYYRSTLLLRPPGHPKRATSLFNSASCLWTRFEKGGVSVDLEEAIACFREALDLCPPGHPDRSRCLNLFAAALLSRFEQNGRWEDQEESIRFHRESLSLRPPGHPERPTSLSNLASSLLARYKQQGDMKDLEEAIDYSQDAVLLFSKDSPYRPAALSNVANGLMSRFELYGRRADLDESIYCLRNSLLLRPEGNPDRSMCVSNLASCLGTLFEKEGKLEISEEAIHYHREALSLRSQGHPHRSNSFLNLAKALLDQFKLSGDVKRVDEAVECLQQACQESPPNHPQLADILSMSASATLTYIHTSESARKSQLDEAFQYLRKAADHPTASAQVRFRRAFKWATLASTHKHDSRLEAYRICLDLLDRFLLIRPSLVDRHKHLSGVIPTAIASDAASCAIEAGQLETAVEFLEQGKTILWSQLGRYRTPLDELHKADKNLAVEFENISIQIESSMLSLGPQIKLSKSLEEVANSYRRLSYNWDQLVEKIRKLDGFDTFLKTTPFSVVKQASTGGPVVVLNISESRSDAIIVRNEYPPSLVPLPDVNLKDIDRISSEFSRALLIHAEQTRKRKVITILQLLWHDVVKPVVDHLQSLGVPFGSRIWWCVTSKLSSLPLHAAGPHKRSAPNLPDLFVSSYTPTLSALLKSSVILPTVQQTIPDLLLVAQHDVPGQQEIQNVLEELETVKRVAPSVKVLRSAEGYRDAVLDGLRTHRWVHFASHGSQNLGEPFNARFHLHDQPLTLLDIIQARLPQAEFAFLSACHTAAGDKHTPDETIHLAAGLQFSGFRSVIGTLWRIADVDGPIVAEEVYKYLFRRSRASDEGSVVDYRDAAVALNIATKALKSRGVPVERWINFVHIGS